MLTSLEGLASAKLKAARDAAKFAMATRLYGNILAQFMGHWPRNIAMGHLLWVNPGLKTILPILSGRRGFMMARREDATFSEVAWEKLDELTPCAYVFGCGVNRTSLSFYTENLSVFLTAGEDFWRCSYLKYILGDAAFTTLWDRRDETAATVYAGLLDAVESTTKSLPGWPLVQLKHTTFLGCNYVFEMAKRGGGFVGTGFGIQPVLSRGQMQQIYTQA